jgi:hypothetical protein
MVGVYPYAIAQAAVRLSSTPCPTSRQFRTDAGDAENRGAVVATQPAAEAVKIGVVSHDRYVAFQMAT